MKKISKAVLTTILSMGILLSQVQPASAKTEKWSLRHIIGAPTSEQRCGFVRHSCSTTTTARVKVSGIYGEDEVVCEMNLSIGYFSKPGDLTVKTKKKARFSVEICFLNPHYQDRSSGTVSY